MNASSVLGGRSAGVLLHPTSLPGPFGIGDLGPTADAWIETLAAAGQTWWQVLPLGPTGQGDSPYSALSAFAGNPLLVSPELLLREGLVAEADLHTAQFPPGNVDYDNVQKYKHWLIDKAGATFRGAAPAGLKPEYDRFCHDHAEWLDDYVLYAAIKEAHGGGGWHDWPRPLQRHDSTALTKAKHDLAPVMDRHRFRQFIFNRHWRRLRNAAHEKGIRIIGDAPIFVAADSADAWAHPDIFLFDADRKPKVVAGVPPDYFSETGQLWGNPLYNWPALKKTHYRWWVRRFRALLDQVDLIRLDHFRGFVAAWHIPAGAETAVKGEWVPGPGKDLFDAVGKELGRLPLIAEDLGEITKEVHALRAAISVPGMRILQFAFGGDPTFRFLPHNFDRDTVAYTGTHDNDTTAGWFAKLPESERKFFLSYAPAAMADPVGELIRLAWSSVADLAVTPLQDILNLGTEARMNLPGMAVGNWSWRVTDEELTRTAFDRLGEWTWLYGRKPKPVTIAGFAHK